MRAISMSNIALQADLGYNMSRNIVESERAWNTTLTVINLLRRSIVNTVPQDASQKQCTRPDCQQWFPATPEFFHRDKTKKDGLFSWCKSCTRAYDAARLKNNPERYTQGMNRLEHYKNTPGYREKMHARYHLPEIRERRNTRNRERYRQPEIREQMVARQKKYEQRPEIQEYMKWHKKAYRRRPEIQKHRKLQSKVYQQRPEVKERSRLRSLQRIAQKKLIAGEYTLAQITEQLKRQQYRCYYAACGYAKFKKQHGRYIYHIEHTFPIHRVIGTDIPANSIDYLVLACPSCNTSKSDRYPWEWPEGGRLL